MKNQQINKIIKLIKKRYPLFIIVSLTIFMSTFSLFILDKISFCRPQSLTNEGLINIFNHNVTINDWLLFIINFMWIYIAYFTYTFYSAINKKIANKYSNSARKATLIYNFSFFGILACILGSWIACFIVFFPWNIYNSPTNEFNAVNFICSIGIFLLLLVFWFIIFAIVSYIIIFANPIFIKIKELCKKYKICIKNWFKTLNEKKKLKTKLKKQKYKKLIAETLPWQIFPALNKIDEMYNLEKNDKKSLEKDNNSFEYNLFLRDFIPQFQAFMANKYNLYFDLPMLRSFVAGMNASRLILLEGISGTGKTTLPRMFNLYVGSKANFFPVQATWRDRTDLIGYYSEFSKQFKETEFLKCLYESNYNSNKVNLMVLDEMNISRVEYYFADFLSILEYPKEDWLIPLMNSYRGLNFPNKIDDGKIRILSNTWFIGTINVDDSTFTVSDKVYDRAIVIDFKELSNPIKCKHDDNAWPISTEQLHKVFKYCCSKTEFNLDDKEKAKFNKLCEYTCDLFDINFGNRIYNQVILFIPVYVGLGGTKDEAIDFMYARKILRKIDGRYENYIRAGLTKLLKYIHTAYGKGKLKETEIHIKKLMKKLN